MTAPSPEILRQAVFELVEECRTQLRESVPDVGEVDRGVRAYCDMLAALPLEESRKHRPDLEAMMEAVTLLSDELKRAHEGVKTELQALDRIRQANAAYQRSRAIGDKKGGAHES